MPLRAANLRVEHRPGRPVLQDLSATFAPGVLTAIVGPNGSGKTTLLRTLAGLMTPRAGRVELDGHCVHTLPATRRARRIAYLAQEPALDAGFSVAQYVALGAFAHTAHPGGPARGAEPTARLRERLAQLDLADRADEPFHTLSVGQRQRAALARALTQLDDAAATDGAPAAAAPLAPPGLGRVLLADEPTGAMDPRHALAALALLRARARAGLVIVCVLHDLTLAARFADWALVLGPDGRAAAHGPVGESLTPAVLGSALGVPFRFAGVDDGVLIPAWSPDRAG